MLERECGCTETYQQPKLFDPWNLLIICVDCGEVLEEVAAPPPSFPTQGNLFSTESTE
jgi:hypothetical protein